MLLFYRIINAVKEPVVLSDGLEVEVGISVGAVVASGKDVHDLDKIVKLADELMYEAKRRGGNTYVVKYGLEGLEEVTF